MDKHVSPHDFLPPDAQDARGVACWVTEEMAELHSAPSQPARLDAIFDALGILLAYLCLFSPAELLAAFAEYRSAQLRRSRSVAAPHHALIEAAVHRLSSMIGAGFATSTTGVRRRLRAYGELESAGLPSTVAVCKRCERGVSPGLPCPACGSADRVKTTPIFTEIDPHA